MVALPEKFTEADVARLATVGEDGQPHLVPIVFAVRQNTIVTAVDGKPKSTTRLKRLANITANPKVSLLVDHYGRDWSQLWWVRVDGVATITEDAAALDALRVKYPQYRQVPLHGPVIEISVERIKTWGLN
ncbi:PPOX class F420-dependent oxidoreductase [Mycolicibacterium murale]|jgi:PPOX class probable F420-dependent enzyme|uniref:PPOX class F420-dependent oxidoreductase n=1 Tax=Mycolicibacterium murale TaxID=182220 RepID=A0A7I9WGP3_9MYCO|nr:TIGR03668 family PPOX class F420-dependent oxidoreductase [Mycolicibacterium murale]ANW66977.1 PPOX class F420-dependent oxidoreductase [Mycobacterium sp. djl-10]MCV7180697.1 TIGR03668 family PPOX class F420-dependent oxidoreductase [Mycolicibacterium murale]GFG56921.1 PPOX class F420-dependent oxidoreductase [Mycolicibacterium murale]